MPRFNNGITSEYETAMMPEKFPARLPPLDHYDKQALVAYLQTHGYIVIEPNHVNYCQYVTGDCPYCGHNTQDTIGQPV